MGSLAFFHEPRVPRLIALLREIRQGQIQVPRFQRPFIWTDEQRLALCESIYSGYPIGSILVWRTAVHRLAVYDGLGPLRLPVSGDEKEPVVRQYLLDGHQRLTTLFVALGPGLYSADPEGPALQWTDETAEEELRWPIYFDLTSDKNQPFRLPLHSARKPPAYWLPLDILFDSYKLRDFEKRLQETGHSPALINRVQAVADAFRDYAVPVMPIVTEDLSQVTKSFKRVNNGGTPMSEVHMVKALTWKPDFDLQERLDDMALQLEPLGWGHFDPQMLLTICKVRLQLDPYDADEEEVARWIAQAPRVLDDACAAMKRAVQVLAEVAQVKGPQALPYAEQAVLLAELIPVGLPLAEGRREQLWRWFWVTTLTEHFRSMTTSLYEQSREHLRALLTGPVEPYFPETAEGIEPLRRFDFRSARSRALALMLAEQWTPALFGCDAQAELARHGEEALIGIVAHSELSKTQHVLAEGPENRFLLPPGQSKELRAHLANASWDEQATIFMAHRISGAAHAAFQQGDMTAFLLARRQSLREMERARAEEVGLQYRDI